MSRDKRERENPRRDDLRPVGQTPVDRQPDEHDTPDELAKLAGSLAEIAPHASSFTETSEATAPGSPLSSDSDLARLNRDRLMYESGHAAALAELEKSTALPSTIASSDDTAHMSTLPSWTWPTASAVSTLAALLLLALWVTDLSEPQIVEKIVYVQQESGQPQGATAANGSSSQTSTDSPDGVDQPGRTPDSSEYQYDTLAARQGRRHLALSNSLSSNYLALRDRALWLGIDTLPSPTAHNSEDFKLTPPKSRQELMQELLYPKPGRNAAPPSDTPDMSRFESHNKRTV